MKAWAWAFSLACGGKGREAYRDRAANSVLISAEKLAPQTGHKGLRPSVAGKGNRVAPSSPA
jgi:hypothetical protein